MQTETDFEFCDHGSVTVLTPPTEAALDPFTRGYIEAMFFTSTDHAEDEALEHASFSEFEPSELARIIADCDAWRATNAPLLAAAYETGYGPTQAGCDYWYTRNGHGVGFWDRDELPAIVREALTELAQAEGECELYRGDNGRLFMFPPAL